jgi:hypothetical protein
LEGFLQGLLARPCPVQTRQVVVHRPTNNMRWSLRLVLDTSGELPGRVTRTLDTRLESTQSGYKGLESFILSDLPPTVANDLGDFDLSPNFRAALVTVYDRARSFRGNSSTIKVPTTTLASHVSTMDPRADTDDASTHIKVETGVKNTLILSDDCPFGYLYLPAILIPDWLPADDYSTPDSPPVTPATLLTRLDGPGTRTLIADIQFSRYVADLLQPFLSNPIVDLRDSYLARYLSPRPVQVYVLSKTGTLRIFSNRSARPSDYYIRQFDPYHRFDARPYFVEAIQKPAPSSFQTKLKDLFYISDPYVDYGGNGIVVTASIPLRETWPFTFGPNGISDTVLAVDLPFLSTYGIRNVVWRRMQQLNATIVDANCRIGKAGSVQCEAADPSIAYSAPGGLWQYISDWWQDNSAAKNALVDQLQSYIESPAGSEASGSIEVINKPDSYGAEAALQPLQVAVPIGKTVLDTDDSSRTVRFVVAEVDPTGYGRHTTYIALLAGLSFFIAAIVLAGAAGSAMEVGNELKAAFLRIADVMDEIPAAYVWLGTDDMILKANGLFFTLLGYGDVLEIPEELKHKTFRRLCADAASVHEYDRVEELRKRGEPVDP